MRNRSNPENALGCATGEKGFHLTDSSLRDCISLVGCEKPPHES